MWIRAVYDATELAMPVEMKALTLSITSTGNWVWRNGSWTRWMDLPKAEGLPVRAGYGTEWFSLYWEMQPFGMEQGGCAYTCHTIEGGKGYVQADGHILVNEQGLSGKPDQWNILARRGYGSHETHDEAWIRAQPLHGDVGRMPYRRNGLEGPIYMESDPVSWADAVTLTGAEIADGGAVLVAAMTATEIAEA